MINLSKILRYDKNDVKPKLKFIYIRFPFMQSLDQQLEQASKEIISRVKELQASTAWVQNGNDPCRKFKMDIGPRVAAKGIHIVPFSMQKVIDFLKQDDTLGKLNPQLIQMKILHQKDEVTKLIYMQYSGVWPVYNRDFVNVVVAHKVNQDKVIIGTQAFNHQAPQVPKVVRGQVFIGAYILQRVDENHTKVTYISDADLKGWIPGFLKNALSQLQGGIAHKIEQVMKKENY